MVEPSGPGGLRAPAKKDVVGRNAREEEEVPSRRPRVESDAETWYVGVPCGHLQAPYLRLRWFES